MEQVGFSVYCRVHAILSVYCAGEYGKDESSTVVSGAGQSTAAGQALARHSSCSFVVICICFPYIHTYIHECIFYLLYASYNAELSISVFIIQCRIFAVRTTMWGGFPEDIRPFRISREKTRIHGQQCRKNRATQQSLCNGQLNRWIKRTLSLLA